MASNPSNPNGANQYNLDPRQKMCWEFYINPKSETFGSARASAMKAGYEEEYANQITTSEWFIVKLRRLNMLGKAEKVLDDMLTMPVLVVDKFGNERKKKSVEDEDDMDDEEQELITRTDPALVKIKQDTAKFLAERLGKDDGYSTRSELTAKDGEQISLGVVMLPPRNTTVEEIEDDTTA